MATAAAIPVTIVVYEQIAESNATISPMAGFALHIDHIIFVILENHAYDNLFGEYCTALSTVCPYISNGLPPGLCVPQNSTDPSGGCVRPWNLSRAEWSVPDMPHDYLASHAAWSNGRMNGFFLSENASCKPCGTSEPFGHYNGSTVPVYWDLAQEYGLEDNFYSSLLSYSLPNHWHIIAGQSPQVAVGNFTVPPDNKTLNVARYISMEHLYLNQSNSTTSIEDLLLRSNVSWKYYDYSLGEYGQAISFAIEPNGTAFRSVGGAYDYWNPEAAKAESYNVSFSRHFVPNTQFFSDAAGGDLPSISWVIPPGSLSDHPPNNSTLAQGWLASLVDAIGRSPDWSSTAMFITWDDYGGFYDHVSPPTWWGQQLGFRVPLLIVSPWTRPGYIDHSLGFFESVLHLMEGRFNLGCIAPLDCTAPLPLGSFDWQLPQARAPVYIPTTAANATYPLQATSFPPGMYLPPAQFTYFPAGEPPDLD